MCKEEMKHLDNNIIENIKLFKLWIVWLKMYIE